MGLIDAPILINGELMLAAAADIEAGNAESAKLLTLEHGKPLSESIHDLGGAPKLLCY